LIKTRRTCKTCGIEKSLGEFPYHSCVCKGCKDKRRKKELDNLKELNKKKLECYRALKEWHEDTCSNDCDNCGFHKYCQRVIDIFDDTNWSEGEG
jgi:hypothetical protein